MRPRSEKNIVQARELYERFKDAVEAVLDSWEKSFDATNQGSVALNRKIIDIAQRNIDSGFDLARSLAGAQNLAVQPCHRSRKNRSQVAGASRSPCSQRL